MTPPSLHALHHEAVKKLVRDQFTELQIETEIAATRAAAKPRQPLEMSEYERVKLFLGIQIGFLLLTPFTGGFRFALWSMMDTALMIQAIGITALAAVLPEELAADLGAVGRGAVLPVLTGCDGDGRDGVAA